MNQLYLLINEIKDTFLNNGGFTKTVTFGDISDVDLSKQTLFPLAHTIIGQTVYREDTWVVTFDILVMDILDQSKDAPVDAFTPNTNLQDILNTQLNVVGLFLDTFKRGASYGAAYQLINEPVLEPFLDRFENQLAGWALSLDIEIKNTICE